MDRKQMDEGKVRRTIAVVGAGPAALMFCASVNTQRFEVTCYEKNNAPGRKFLVAGDGGLNITHSEPPARFITRYTPWEFLHEAFGYFNNLDLVGWLNGIGIPTFAGTSGRVFPARGIKPVDVLNLLVGQVKANGVTFKFRHEWVGWGTTGTLLFRQDGMELQVNADLVVFALGGGSWPVTGSNARWMGYFTEKGIVTKPFEASNCAVQIAWPPEFIGRFAGRPLKNVMLQCGAARQAGEVVITREGLEGSGVYPLSPQIREQLHNQGVATLCIDLRPMYGRDEVLERIVKGSGKGSRSERLRSVLGLSRMQLALLKLVLGKEDFMNAEQLSGAVKCIPLQVRGMASVNEAISTVGGIPLAEIDERFMLRALPGHYIIGEMLDYDAPTGGYLLQSCFTMGRYLAHLLDAGQGPRKA